ncbi:DUF1304 domain-containing protein [Corallococcus sp. H22C18031201]|nr:DUF1304 domain-containing protein [Corallococcus sp. H22C18031201]
MLHGPGKLYRPVHIHFRHPGDSAVSVLLAVSLVATGLAALLHILFFVFESVLWRKPATWKRFGIASQADADTLSRMAYNQGFYNLFLAVGALVGVGAVLAGAVVQGRTLVLFTMAVMVGAGAVLLSSDRRFLRAAMMQAGPPAIAIIAALLG